MCTSSNVKQEAESACPAAPYASRGRTAAYLQTSDDALHQVQTPRARLLLAGCPPRLPNGHPQLHVQALRLAFRRPAGLLCGSARLLCLLVGAPADCRFSTLVQCYESLMAMDTKPGIGVLILYLGTGWDLLLGVILE